MAYDQLLQNSMLLILPIRLGKKNDYETKVQENIPDHDKCITTPEFNKRLRYLNKN